MPLSSSGAPVKGSCSLLQECQETCFETQHVQPDLVWTWISVACSCRPSLLLKPSDSVAH